MSHTKCHQCGLVNFATDEVCERCGGPLSPIEANAPAQEFAPPNIPAFTFGQDVSSGSRTLKVILIVIVVIAIGGGAWALYKQTASSRRASNSRRVFPPLTVEERTRDTLLAYLAQPGFAGERLAEQVLGPARLELLQVSDREVYFSVPQPDQTGQTFEAIIARFVVDPKRIVLAEDDGEGRLRLGKYSLRQSMNKHYFLRRL